MSLDNNIGELGENLPLQEAKMKGVRSPKLDGVPPIPPEMVPKIGKEVKKSYLPTPPPYLNCSKSQNLTNFRDIATIHVQFSLLGNSVQHGLKNYP